MAGGAGTRFWPLSRRKKPKQFLPLAGAGASLLAATVARIAPMIDAEHVLVVTNKKLVTATARALTRVPSENILAEPVGRNTAPCIAWAAAHVRRRDPDAVLAVLPADHYIANPEAFLVAAGQALSAASDGMLVTIGIQPTRAETGFGYIEMGEGIGVQPGVRRAQSFTEKPDRALAEQLVAGRAHLWNSGMFFFGARAIQDAIARHLPELAPIADAPDDDAVRRMYKKL